MTGLCEESPYGEVVRVVGSSEPLDAHLSSASLKVGDEGGAESSLLVVSGDLDGELRRHIVAASIELDDSDQAPVGTEGPEDKVAVRIRGMQISKQCARWRWYAEESFPKIVGICLIKGSQKRQVIGGPHRSNDELLTRPSPHGCRTSRLKVGHVSRILAVRTRRKWRTTREVEPFDPSGKVAESTACPQEVVHMTSTTMITPEVDAMHSDATPRIVVGVDGSEQSLNALRWASERARISGEQVEPVYVFNSVLPTDFSGFGGPIPVAVASAEALAESATVRLAHSIDSVAHEHVAFEPKIIDAPSPVAALVKEASGASMLVLGVHRRHWMDGTVGSTARACLKHAPCAVVVVPATADDDSDDTVVSPR